MTNADEQSSKGSNDGDDLMNAIMAPLMGGMPDIERIMQDVESGQESSAPKVEEPSAPKVEAATFVSKDEATQAVKTAISAKGLAFDSPQKRQASSHEDNSSLCRTGSQCWLLSATTSHPCAVKAFNCSHAMTK